MVFFLYFILNIGLHRPWFSFYLLLLKIQKLEIPSIHPSTTAEEEVPDLVDDEEEQDIKECDSEGDSFEQRRDPFGDFEGVDTSDLGGPLTGVKSMLPTHFSSGVHRIKLTVPVLPALLLVLRIVHSDWTLCIVMHTASCAN